MSGEGYEVRMKRGTTFQLSLTYEDTSGATPVPIDITGYDAVMHVRKNVKDASPIVEMSNSNGRITITGASGQLDVSVAATDTASLPLLNNGVWEIMIRSPGGIVTSLASGPASISAAAASF